VIFFDHFFGEKPDRKYYRKERRGTAGEWIKREKASERPLRPETPPVHQTIIPLLLILFPAAIPTTFVSLLQCNYLPEHNYNRRNTPIQDIYWPTQFSVTLICLNSTELYLITGNEKLEQVFKIVYKFFRWNEDLEDGF